MNEPADLLPSNASTLERNLSKSIARLSDVPMMVRKSWNPDECPVELLPWLAWAFSVDEWDDTWSESAKRGVIKNAAYVHRKKGTLSAIRRAVDPLGYIIKTVEWFEDEPQGVPLSFRIEVTVTETALTETTYNQIVRLVETYKNERSHMSQLLVSAEVRGITIVSAVSMSGVETTVYPYSLSELESAEGIFVAVAEHTIDTVNVYPN